MLINLKGCYTISGKIVSKAKESRLQFNVPLEGNPPIIVEIIPSENSAKRKVFTVVEGTPEQVGGLEVRVHTNN